MPKDEALAPNPPNGAYIDYVISQAQKVTLEISDDHDMLVRSYTTEETPPGPNPAKLTTAPEWFDKPSTLSGAPGMHRFVWPIRYPQRNAKDAYSNGVWAPPGHYKVVLTVDGSKFTQQLTVVPDPRIPPYDYAAQFALAREVDEARSRIIAARNEKNPKAASIADDAPSSMWWLPPTSTTSLRFLDQALQRLLNAVDGADAPPSPDAKESWAKLKPIVEETLRKWQELKR